MVLATFSICNQFCFTSTIRLDDVILRCVNFCTYFQWFFNVFSDKNAWRCFRKSKKMPTTRWHHDAFNSAQVQKVWLCVMYFAFSLCTIFGNFSGCSTYVTFSITFSPPVLQSTICVMFFAPHRSFPWSILGGRLVLSAARSGRDLRDATAPPGITSPRSPRNAPSNPPDATTSTCRFPNWSHVQ